MVTWNINKLTITVYFNDHPDYKKAPFCKGLNNYSNIINLFGKKENQLLTRMNTPENNDLPGQIFLMILFKPTRFCISESFNP